jgi:hypothetical protein
VASLAGEVVAEIAPEELPIFLAMREAYIKNPRRALRRQPVGDEMLGFGGEAVQALVTPVAFAAVKLVIETLAAACKKSLEKEAACYLKAVFKRIVAWIKRRSNVTRRNDRMQSGAPVKRCEDVHQIVIMVAREFRLVPTTAERLACAVAARIPTKT